MFDLPTSGWDILLRTPNKKKKDKFRHFINLTLYFSLSINKQYWHPTNFIDCKIKINISSSWFIFISLIFSDVIS